jgi:hypothetical protein
MAGENLPAGIEPSFEGAVARPAGTAGGQPVPSRHEPPTAGNPIRLLFVSVRSRHETTNGTWIRCIQCRLMTYFPA